jgi:hypothetical protein
VIVSNNIIRIALTADGIVVATLRTMRVFAGYALLSLESVPGKTVAAKASGRAVSAVVHTGHSAGAVIGLIAGGAHAAVGVVALAGEAVHVLADDAVAVVQAVAVVAVVASIGRGAGETVRAAERHAGVVRRRVLEAGLALAAGVDRGLARLAVRHRARLAGA